LNQIPPASDNLFLRSYAAWRAHSVKLTGKLLLMVLIPLAALLLLLGVAKLQLNSEVARQADGAGTELARQIAASLAEPLSADDQLSLNIQLAQWKRNPLISHVRLYTAENRLIAEAGDEPGRRGIAPGQGQFNAVVHFQETIVGQVQLYLAAEPFVGPANTLLWRLVWGTMLLALIAGLVAWRVARSMRLSLLGLGLWYGDSGQAVPGFARRDELGDLARQLGERQIIDMPPEPEPEPVPEAATTDHLAQSMIAGEETSDPGEADGRSVSPDDLLEPKMDIADAIDKTGGEEKQNIVEQNIAPEPTSGFESDPQAPPTADPLTIQQPPETAILAVRLGNQDALRRLPRPRLMALLDRYREQLQRACELYSGRLQTFHDGTSLVVFHARECRHDELTHALCCGELLRVLGHELQVEIADTGITLHLQLAIGHVSDLKDIPTDALAERPECQAVIGPVQFSRNLLLLDATLADSASLKERAVVRRLASQPGIYCIERLHVPYQAMLEQQLRHFNQQRPG
jgi:hypothetical protein